MIQPTPYRVTRGISDPDRVESSRSESPYGNPWHYGFGANPRDREHPAQYERGSWEPPGGEPGRILHGLPSFVPPRFHDPLAAAALRWNVPVELLAAQLYAESGFNPFAESPAGARGIAQFMPGVPPYAETRAYVARILGLLGGAGVIPVDAFEVRLVE
jgi:hypothetical protein